MDVKKLMSAGMNQIALYSALITDMNRHERYADSNPRLAKFNGKKAIERLEQLERTNKIVYDGIGEHVFYTG